MLRDPRASGPGKLHRSLLVILNGRYGPTGTLGAGRRSDYRSIPSERESLVDSVISTRTGLPVLLWIIDARSFTRPAAKTSGTRRPTRPRPRSLLSTAC